jgi:hypothetical protein
MKDITYVPLTELVKPRERSTVMLDRWWVVHPDKGALIYRRYAHQCNRQREVVDRLLKMYPGCHAEFIPVAYVETPLGD